MQIDVRNTVRSSEEVIIRFADDQVISNSNQYIEIFDDSDQVYLAIRKHEIKDLIKALSKAQELFCK